MPRTKNTDDKTPDQEVDQTDGQTVDPTADDTVDFGDRPELPDGGPAATNLEILSHNWQSGSPAVDMRDISKPLTNVDNLVERLAREADGTDVAADGNGPVVLASDEHKARTQLDVSDPNYVNPSLEHHTVEGK